jgi:hypothetical protein
MDLSPDFSSNNYGFYRANVRRQKGYGLGGIFGTLARHILPFVKRHVWPHAKQALKDIAVDTVVNRVPIKEAVKKRGIGALKAAGSSVLNQSGKGRRRRKRKKKSTAKKGKTSKSKKRRKLSKKKKPKSSQVGRGNRKTTKKKKSPKRRKKSKSSKSKKSNQQYSIFPY